MLIRKIALTLAVLSCTACTTLALPPPAPETMTLEFQAQEHRRFLKEDRAFMRAHKIVTVAAVAAMGASVAAPVPPPVPVVP